MISEFASKESPDVADLSLKENYLNNDDELN